MKILVCGHFNSGKTTFITTISNVGSFSTEKKSTARNEKLLKSSTTTAMDYGKFLCGEEKISLFGIPGQERFSFMWELLAKGKDGFIFMLDSTTPFLWEDTLRQIEIIVPKGRPFILCANKQDLPDAIPVHIIHKELGLNENIPIFPCIAKDKSSSLQTFKRIIKEFKMCKYKYL